MRRILLNRELENARVVVLCRQLGQRDAAFREAIGTSRAPSLTTRIESRIAEAMTALRRGERVAMRTRGRSLDLSTAVDKALALGEREAVWRNRRDRPELEWDQGRGPLVASALFTSAVRQTVESCHKTLIDKRSSSSERILLGVSETTFREITMGQRSFGVLVWRGLGAALLFGAGIAHAGIFDVTINSPSLFGSPAVLAFDFNDGGPPDNTVTLSTLTSGGTQSSTATDGNVSGTGPWIFSDVPPSLFNELRVTFDPMGSSLTFSFTTTDNPPDGGSLPDAFSFFILNPDPNANSPFLITTDDPTGANALFLYSIGQGTDGLSVFTPDQSGFSFTVAPAQAAPEPASLALVAAGLAALSARRRRKR